MGQTYKQTRKTEEQDEFPAHSQLQVSVGLIVIFISVYSLWEILRDTLFLNIEL